MSELRTLHSHMFGLGSTFHGPKLRHATCTTHPDFLARFPHTFYRYSPAPLCCSVAFKRIGLSLG